ncbi:MAG: hypothetical protein ACK4G4_09795 [Thermus sp.]|nr:hypothetical protein [Thermus neutrinimicus]
MAPLDWEEWVRCQALIRLIQALKEAGHEIQALGWLEGAMEP